MGVMQWSPSTRTSTAVSWRSSRWTSPWRRTAPCSTSARTESYEGGQFVNSTDAWLSGVNGAESGTFMPAVLRVGMPAFRQALVPGEGAVTAEVVKTSQRTCVPYRCFSNVVVLEEDGSEHKYFAPEWAAS